MDINTAKLIDAIEAVIIWHDLALGSGIAEIERMGGRPFPRRLLIEALGELDDYLKPKT